MKSVCCASFCIPVNGKNENAGALIRCTASGIIIARMRTQQVYGALYNSVFGFAQPSTRANEHRKNYVAVHGETFPGQSPQSDECKEMTRWCGGNGKVTVQSAKCAHFCMRLRTITRAMCAHSWLDGAICASLCDIFSRV